VRARNTSCGTLVREGYTSVEENRWGGGVEWRKGKRGRKQLRRLGGGSMGGGGVELRGGAM